jgi:hypothetical protein
LIWAAAGDASTAMMSIEIEKMRMAGKYSHSGELRRDSGASGLEPQRTPRTQRPRALVFLCVLGVHSG